MAAATAAASARGVAAVGTAVGIGVGGGVGICVAGGAVAVVTGLACRGAAVGAIVAGGGAGGTLVGGLDTGVLGTAGGAATQLASSDVAPPPRSHSTSRRLITPSLPSCGRGHLACQKIFLLAERQLSRKGSYADT
jgi:hypothetical protein